MPLISNNDMVYRTEGNCIAAGAYAINSCMMRKQYSPITTMNDNFQSGERVSNMLNNLAIPAGLFSLQQTQTEKSNLISKKNYDIPETLYDKLFLLAQDKSHRKKTKKCFPLKGKRKTKKYY